MSALTDNALQCLEAAATQAVSGNIPLAQVDVLEAQTYALLEIGEQLRVANLVARGLNPEQEDGR